MEKREQGPIMLLHNNCFNCISIAQQLHNWRKMEESMNYNNRHLSDLSNIFRTLLEGIKQKRNESKISQKKFNEPKMRHNESKVKFFYQLTKRLFND